MFHNQLRGSEAHLAEMLSLDVAAAEDDPTAIVNEYLNPWWAKPAQVGVYVMDGLEQFSGNVRTTACNVQIPADPPTDKLRNTGGSNFV